MKNTFVYTVIFTFVICFVFVLFLSFTNVLLKDKITANAEFTKNKAILLALGVPESEVATKEQVDLLQKDVEVITRNDRTYYNGDFSGVSANALAFAGPGLWGTIYGYIAFSEDGSQIIGFQVTDHNETPGLGARIAEPWFIEQLRGESIQNSNIIVGAGGSGDGNKDNGRIDGVSGATRTSDSIQAILSNNIRYYYEDWR